MIVALPGATAATTPEDETVALEESDVVHKKERCSSWPDASLAVAVSWTVAVGTNLAVSTEIMMVSVVGGGGPITLSLPAQERMSQPRASDQMKRVVVFVSEPLVTGRTRYRMFTPMQHTVAIAPHSQLSFCKAFVREPSATVA